MKHISYLLRHGALAVAMLLATGAQAQKLTQNGVIYAVKDKKAFEAEIIGYVPGATRVIIESEVTIDNVIYNVVGVSDEDKHKEKISKYVEILKGGSDVREMVFSKQCTEVFYMVANHFPSLEKVTLPEGITRIGFSAFHNCEKLKGVVIPSTVKIIDSSAFEGCKSLTEITLPAGLEKLGSHAFSETGLTSLIVPPSVKEMENGVVARCKQLTSVVFLNKPTSLVQSFFYGCAGLQSLVLPNSLEQVEKNAFTGCKNLRNLVVPDRCKYVAEEETNTGEEWSIYHGSFYECTALENIKCHNGTVPQDIVKYLPSDCPFAASGGKLTDPDFDKPLLAEVGKAQELAAKASGQGEVRMAQTTTSDVDRQIPQTEQVNDHTYALIIGNERYTDVPAATFAAHDAEVFAEYCNKTLGLPEGNISLHTNQTYGEMLAAVRQLGEISKAHEGRVDLIFYFSGHGTPDETTHAAYLMPVDADGTMTEVCYALSRLYQDLADSKARSITVLLDAAFSGAGRDGGVLQAEARGVAIKPKAATALPNMVVLSAATGDEAAFAETTKAHGLFTYSLLKKLQESQGNVTLGNLFDYVKAEVPKAALGTFKKPQTPTVSVPEAMKAGWREKAWK